MSARILLLVGLLALPGIGCRDKGALKVTISFPDFKPGCLRVSIRDALGASDERTTELTSGLAEKKAGEQVTVAAWREAGWSNSLSVTALAYERSCEGTPVDTQSTTVNVEDGRVAEAELRLVARDADGDGYVAASTNGTDCDDTQDTVHPGQSERCNDRDDNCDGQRDEGLSVGQACVNTLGCGGTRACATDGSVECRQTQATFRLYADRDNDGYGAGPAEESCMPSRPGYSSNADDCDDTRAEVNPGASERCDSLDNNCNGQKDEGLGVGDTCDESNGCGGKKECTPGGEIRCVYATEPANHYPDDDRDGYGRNDGAVMTCKPPEGYVLQGGDCNDSNAFTHPGAVELCDQEDNNCDTAKDEGNACPAGGAKWTEYSSGGSDSWKSVSLWDEGRGVWVAGGNKYEVRRPGQSTFETPTSQCAGATSLNAVWASAPDGAALLGGNSGFLGGHIPGGNCITSGAFAAETDVQGLTEVPWPAGKLELHFGGVRNSAGRMFWSDKQTSPSIQDVDKPVYDVHGLSRDALFAVGGTDPALIVLPGEPRIYRFKTGTAPWTVESIQSGPIPVVNNRLRGVWVVNPRLAYAVGNGGAVLIWDGTTWRTHKSPGSEDLLSVVAFGKRSVYVTTNNGKVFRYGEDDTWTKVYEVPSGKPLHDIAGSSPGNLWVVGDQGKRVHWPD
uniref:Uncharacterized protein n=1 Tax=Melittangium boletus TaxID=83453 RepID=A0A3S7UWS3_9BACT|nr:hypothetical protein [Melittangium boletus]